ncbi:tropomyosin [Mycena sp. CBHHK59/15]|nr:tropomyosin [Mycena sp. CBHHK59/15]
MTDRIREKMNQLRIEADVAVARAEDAEAKNKKYEQMLLDKDHEITSLQVKLSHLDADLEKAESSIADSKVAREEGETSKTTNEGLVRKIQLLEEELDAAEKNVKETVEKLRQVDVKAEHFERQVQRVEQERDMWEKKYEEAQTKYRESKAELDELVATMEGL